jgi:hypothetical protein
VYWQLYFLLLLSTLHAQTQLESSTDETAIKPSKQYSPQALLTVQLLQIPACGSTSPHLLNHHLLL